MDDDPADPLHRTALDLHFSGGRYAWTNNHAAGINQKHTHLALGFDQTIVPGDRAVHLRESLSQPT